MGELGYAAMAVGERDLAGGLDALRTQASKGGVTLLSANLVDPQGAPVFEASKVVQVGVVRVGLVGLSTADPKIEGARAYLKARLSATDPVEAAKKAVAALPRVDVVVLLGHLRTVEARRVARAVPEAKLVLISDSGRFTRVGEYVGGAVLYEGGQRGQILMQLEVVLTGEGALQDTASTREAKDLLTKLEAQLRQLSPDAGASFERVKQRLERARAQAGRVGRGGFVTLVPVMLDQRVESDPEVQKRVAPFAAKPLKVASPG